MIAVNSFIQKLRKNKIDFFCGVPDSVLKKFISNLKKHNFKNIVTANEGLAISLASGYYLITKKLPCVYMQNSGLGNAINPLTSIVHKNVYSIPMLLIIGWRGAPNIKDEPQHQVKGAITTKLLNLLKIKYVILDKYKNFDKINTLIKYSKSKKVPVAILIKNNILSDTNFKTRYSINQKYMTREFFFENLLNMLPKKSYLISTTGYTSRELYQIRKSKNINIGKDFYMVGGMGHTSSLSLGVSLNTNIQTFCLDGDGSLLMHMGSLVTNTIHPRKNFKHVLLNNNLHESVGDQKTMANKIDFKLLTKSLGYKNYFIIKSKNDLVKKLIKFIKSNGPSFLEVKINPGSIENLTRPKNLLNLKKKFMMKF